MQATVHIECRIPPRMQQRLLLADLKVKRLAADRWWAAHGH